MAFENSKDKIKQLHELLKSIHGSLGKWWPGTREEIFLTALLTQNTNWKNVEKALTNIKNEKDEKDEKDEEAGEKLLEFLDSLPLEKLQELIRPSGFYKIKAQRLKNLLNWIKKYHFDIEKSLNSKDTLELRRELLNIKGIGKETADSILLYALERPIFVVDTYTKNLLKRMYGLSFKEYDEYREFFQQFDENSVPFYQELHGLIVEHGKKYCGSSPRCEECPISEKFCQYKSAVKSTIE